MKNPVELIMWEFLKTEIVPFFLLESEVVPLLYAIGMVTVLLGVFYFIRRSK